MLRRVRIKNDAGKRIHKSAKKRTRLSNDKNAQTTRDQIHMIYHQFRKTTNRHVYNLG